MYRKTEQCRVCGNRQLELVLDLGTQALTGVFPPARTQLTEGPLRLVRCTGTRACGLVQLEHSYDLQEMYGENYGYRSGLNPSMVQHLHTKVAQIQQRLPLARGDLVVDIGSNDATTLRGYPVCGLQLVGIDPTGSKFHKYYPQHVTLIPDFFSGELLARRFPGRGAKVITSFSMFYDLEEPLKFMREIRESLDGDGIWVFEQSYIPSMLEQVSYDTACHEHLEYYGLEQIVWMAERAGLKVLDVERNAVNGGSFSVVAARDTAPYQASAAVSDMLQQEQRLRLRAPEPYAEFARRVRLSRDQLREFFSQTRSAHKTVGALGASTKGNVILQYCQLSADDIVAVGEVNEEKFGCVTPGSWIPIVPQAELLAAKPDYLLVLPWHFRAFFERNALLSGQTLVFPLPTLQIVRIP